MCRLFTILAVALLCNFANAQTVVDIIVNSPDHTTLEAAVIAAELDDDLSAAGSFTVFAPTDAAFAALPSAFVTGLLANPTGQLAEILTYHVIGAEVLAGDLSDGQTAATLQGEDVTVTINADGVFINNAQVTVTDIPADNGVVHVLDAVMLPPTFPTTVVDVVVNSDVHNTLEAAVVAAELADDLSAAGSFTVFAPTDDAFAALPPAFVTGLLANPTGQLAEILTYHVIGAQVLAGDLSDGQTATTLQGEDVAVVINANGVFINNAQVTITDIVTPNGVVHVLDAVMLPPTFPLTVVDVVVSSDVHNTLAGVVVAAELDDDLNAAGPFTLFAPTDDAFAEIDPDVLNTLLADPTGDLAQILLYHALSGQVLSGDLSDGQTATTLQGEDVTVNINTDGVFINDSEVIIADIVTPNGVVHVLDAVMLPPSFVNVTALEKVNLKLSPNPTADVVWITLPQEMLNTRVEVQIADFTGKILDSQIVNGEQLTLDLTTYPTGNYSILLVSDTSYAINKVIKR